MRENFSGLVAEEEEEEEGMRRRQPEDLIETLMLDSSCRFLPITREGGVEKAMTNMIWYLMMI